MIFDDRSSLKSDSFVFKKIHVNQQFTYLGAEFTPSGLYKIDLISLKNKIDILLQATAKPQQKLFMLKNFLLPSFYHSYIFFIALC